MSVRCASFAAQSESRAIGRGQIFFDSVRVPAEALIGEEGTGFIEVMQGFDFSRALIGLMCIGAAQQSLDETCQYVADRNAFGGALARFEGVSFPLAEAAVTGSEKVMVTLFALALLRSFMAQGPRGTARLDCSRGEMVGAGTRCPRAAPMLAVTWPSRLQP